MESEHQTPQNLTEAEHNLNILKTALPKLRLPYRYLMLGKAKLIPSSVSIHGNMISVFVLFSVLLLLSTLIFKLEILKSYLIVKIFKFNADLKIRIRRISE